MFQKVYSLLSLQQLSLGEGWFGKNITLQLFLENIPAGMCKSVPAG